MESVQILTARFLLRSLAPADATDRYLAWLREKDARRYIHTAGETRTVEDLQAYIAQRCWRADVLFLGIFSRGNGEHIGNIKYEPIDAARSWAEMGILIGEPAWRGRGVAQEVIRATTLWIRTALAIKQVSLGVASDNHAALSAYRRAGFRQTEVADSSEMACHIIRMTLDIPGHDSDKGQ